MINEIQLNGRSIVRPVAERVASAPRAKARSMHKHGFGGALLGATSFGALFPLAISAAVGAVGATDMVVYAMSGALFGVVSGGAIGAVIGAEGR